MDAEFKPLVDAAYAGDFDLFASLIERSPQLVTQKSSDRSDSPNLIQFVVVEGGLAKIPGAGRFLTLLIEKGSTTHRQLVAAASVNSRELVDILLDAGVGLDDGAPWTAVEESLYWGHREMAEYLLNERGAKLETLVSAAMMGDMEKLQSFFDNGKLLARALPIYFPWGPFDESTEEDALAQAFIMAIRHRQYDAAAFLLSLGADINGITICHHEECTALHVAANLNDIEMADWLLERGAAGNVKDRRFKADAIGWAEHQGNAEVAAHLRKRLS